MVAAGPHRRQRQNAHKIVDAPLEMLDLIRAGFERGFHVGRLPEELISQALPLAELTHELFGRYVEGIVLQDSAYHYHRVRPHHIDHGISAEFPEMVRADDGIIVPQPYMIYARFETPPGCRCVTGLPPPSPSGRRCD